jgi:putative hydrolase of the HAD superfamily
MNNTFMFGGDRFNPEEDFYRTYISVGGSRLSRADVTGLIRACYVGMSRDYDDPACYDNFPSLIDGFRRYANPPEEELSFLESVFTFHELGYIPEDCVAVLRCLARTHRLAVVTNIWSPKIAWLSEFKRVGIDTVFQHCVFSSDFSSIKPSQVLYHKAICALDVPAQEAVFVGDSLHRDIEGAKSLGMTTVWLTSDSSRHPCADYLISKLQDLQTCAV